MKLDLKDAFVGGNRSGMARPFSPELDHLIDGYRRFRTNGWTPRLERWHQLREGQEPPVMVIACSDRPLPRTPC